MASYPALLADWYPTELLARALPFLTRPNMSLLTAQTYYLAEAAGVPVGSGGWSSEDPETRQELTGVAFLRHFAVDEAWVGKGIGRAIYLRCAAAARQAGASELQVRSSVNAEPFYAALGFEPLGAMPIVLPGGITFPCIRMHRTIAAS